LPMVGICRGGQFLNVMNKGKMWQHVSDHCRPHDLIVEVPPFTENNQKRRVRATSTHHQMMIPTDEAFIIATALECREKCGPGYTKMGIKVSDPDIEVLWYQDTNCLCFQPHPEHANASADLIDFFEECLENYVLPMKPVKDKSIIKSVPKTKKEEKPKKTLLGIVPKGENKKA
jgi:gamma-glutamyl-gamma-aminobutyrate hydrolase PuuD